MSLRRHMHQRIVTSSLKRPTHNVSALSPSRALRAESRELVCCFSCGRYCNPSEGEVPAEKLLAGRVWKGDLKGPGALCRCARRQLDRQTDSQRALVVAAVHAHADAVAVCCCHYSHRRLPELALRQHAQHQASMHCLCSRYVIGGSHLSMRHVNQEAGNMPCTVAPNSMQRVLRCVSS